MKKISKLVVICLVLTMTVWTFGACGSGGNNSGQDSSTVTAKKVTSHLSMKKDVSSYLKKVDMKYAYDTTETMAYDKDYWDNDLGWRSAGSDAEHKMAGYLEKEMKDIGLQSVEQVGTPCDKFQFNGSSFKLSGTDIDIEPASYQCNGTGTRGLQAEIVDVGHGTEADYAGKDVKGKIVLAGVDQKDEAWIDAYIREANKHGAAALVTYSRSGYGQANDNTANVQDICCPDLIPTCAISKNDAKDIKKALKNGHNKADLMLDAVMSDNDGTTYNVMGVIPGKSHDQRIVIAGHYDKYWYGFQDDSAAIGLVMTVAKAMVDSNYKPENDIVFIAHGGEEWGVTDSQFDWTVGAWGMIEAHKNWQGSTLALINCELPAFKVKGNTLGIGSVPEFRTLAKNFIDKSGLLVTAGKVKMAKKTFDSTTMEDGVSYRWHGVPYFINSFEDDTFIYNNYHTDADNKDTYNKATMHTNINWYGALAMYIDNEPALELDATQAAKDLKANFNKKYAKEAGVDVEKYEAAIEKFEKAGEAQNKKIAKVNKDYEKAVSDKDTKEAAELREEGQQLNETSLKVFQAVQDDFLKDNDFQIYYGHAGVNDNIKYLKGTIKGLENKDLWNDDGKSGALDNAWQINAVHDYGYIVFSTDVVKAINDMYSPVGQVRNQDYWGYQKMIPVVEVGRTTHDLNAVSGDKNPKVDWTAAKKVYQEALDKCLTQVRNYSNQEVKDMGEVTEMLQ
ncbi:MAG: M28 family peptidase [Anaerovoracaceae bacterium]|jgi:hypothetical protein